MPAGNPNASRRIEPYSTSVHRWIAAVDDWEAQCRAAISASRFRRSKEFDPDGIVRGGPVESGPMMAFTGGMRLVKFCAGAVERDPLFARHFHCHSVDKPGD
jgi:hypothetical protein